MICPHCERELKPGHQCPPTRRWFMFGMLLAPVVGLVKPPHTGVQLFLRSPVVDGGPLTREDFERAMVLFQAMREHDRGDRQW